MYDRYTLYSYHLIYVDVPILDRCERCIFEKQVSLTEYPRASHRISNDRICMRRAKFKRATSEKKYE